MTCFPELVLLELLSESVVCLVYIRGWVLRLSSSGRGIGLQVVGVHRRRPAGSTVGGGVQSIVGRVLVRIGHHVGGDRIRRWGGAAAGILHVGGQRGMGRQRPLVVGKVGELAGQPEGWGETGHILGTVAENVGGAAKHVLQDVVFIRGIGGAVARPAETYAQGYTFILHILETYMEGYKQGCGSGFGQKTGSGALYLKQR